MAIARIGEVRARTGSEDALRERLVELIAEIASLPGCSSCELLAAREEPARFMIIERWDSLETHSGAVMRIPKEEIAAFMRLVEGPLVGAYWDEVGVAG